MVGEVRRKAKGAHRRSDKGEQGRRHSKKPGDGQRSSKELRGWMKELEDG